MDKFWYQLGVEVGGPLYTGLVLWIKENLAVSKKKCYFLGAGTTILYQLLKSQNVAQIEYIDLLHSEELLSDGERYIEQYKSDILTRLNSTKLLEEDCCVFACDWYGNLQNLIEEEKETHGIEYSTYFYYVGVLNTDLARKNLHGRQYRPYAFDFYTNYALQGIVNNGYAVTNLFFQWNEDLYDGIADFLQNSEEYVSQFPYGYFPEFALKPLNRLITNPDKEELRLTGREEQIKELEEAEKQEGTEEQEYHLEGFRHIENYCKWIEKHERQKEQKEKLRLRPKFSIVMPVYNTITEQLSAAIESVLKQSYKNYELILVDDCSTMKSVRETLRRYQKRLRVKVIYRTENGHISKATNDGIEIANGDYLVFMDCDDTISPNALYEVAKKINENPEYDFIYSDEDKLTEDGKIRHLPFFKPEWSPDLFLSQNYTNHLSVYRMSIAKKIGGLRSEVNGSQDYDFVLRFMEQSSNSKVGHISKVLYHWRERKESVSFATSSKNYAIDASAKVKLDYIERNRLSAHIEYINGIAQYRMVYDIVNEPLVSIIIPSKDHEAILKQCINSIVKFTNYKNYEIVVVDNGSEEQTRSNIEKYLNGLSGIHTKYHYEKMDFNFSRMCNLGAKEASGELLLFLNDDIEIINEIWLERMVGTAQQKHIGAVGAKLFYPEKTVIQHTGVTNDLEGPGHPFNGSDDSRPYHFSYNWLDVNCYCVTGACLMVRREVFEEIQGFDETLAVSYNDVDLGVTIHDKGYYNVVRTDVVAYHHESLSRGLDHEDEQKMERLKGEREKLYMKHPHMADYDPFKNRNLRYLSSVDTPADNDGTYYFYQLNDCEVPKDCIAGFTERMAEPTNYKRILRFLEKHCNGLYVLLRATKGKMTVS